MREPQRKLRYSRHSGKLTLVAFAKALERRFPRLAEGDARSVWQEGVAILRQALIDGHGVTLEGIGAIIPYVKGATRSYHPGTRKVRDVPARRSMRVRLSPAFADEFVPVLTEAPLS